MNENEKLQSYLKGQSASKASNLLISCLKLLIQPKNDHVHQKVDGLAI